MPGSKKTDNRPYVSAVGLLLVVLAGFARADYPSYAEIENALLTTQNTYPSICKRVYVGETVSGRSMWALRITDNVDVEEDEPEFKYISTMHGNEITGVEMCLRLIEHITTNYGSDSRINNIVDSIDLWIMPCMNPDGYDRSPRRRWNDNNVDLNRDFPNLGDPNTPAGRAAETAAIMAWSAAHSFDLTANFHGGALVVSYPFDNYDSGSNLTPDDDLIVWISEEYSQHNLPMWNGAWYHGITNGADWYVIHGSMEDWNYHFMGCNEVTIELSNNKEPPYSQIPGFWNDNRESMLAYIETCLVGVRGLVTDASTGLPLPATVTVVGRNHEVYTDPDIGDYHRMLIPGTYGLLFEADGYDSVSVPDVVVDAGDATRLDVTLSVPGPTADGDYDEDGDVDMGDFVQLVACFGSGPSPECVGAFDFVANGVVDLEDFAAFSQVLAGPR